MLDSINLHQLLILDIETVPQYPGFEHLPDHTKLLFEHKVRNLLREGEAPADYYSRAGIWAEFGKIICISVGIFNTHEPVLKLRVKSFAGDDECTILGDFISLLDKQASSVVLCAHNGKEFDFPYICRRTLIKGLCIPEQLKISGKKPWEVNHLDTMELWKFGDHKSFTSLNLLASVLDIPTPKDDIDGSDVNSVYWQENDLERIKTYCQKDVITTARLLLRFKGMPLVADENITIVN